jgi:phage gp29-like protein
MLAEVSKRRNKQRGKLTVVASGPAVNGSAVALLKKPVDTSKRIRAGTMQQMPPVAGFLELDRVGQIKSVLRSFEEGSSYEDAAKLADAMLRDDRINGTTSTRWGALVSSPLEIKGARDRRKEKKIAELLSGSDEEPGLWQKMFPREQVSELLHWGRFLGVGVAEILWDYSDPTFATFTIRVWHPQFLRWNYTKGIYQIRTRDELVDLPSTEENGASDGKWILYTPYGFRSPWRRALIRPLAMLYLCRQWAMRDWSRYSEKHGMPADVVEIPDNAPDDEKAKVMTDVANRGSEAALFFPVPADEKARGYKFSIVEAMGRSVEVFEKLLSKVEVDIAVTVLGQNLTTEVQGGSRAAADVHDGVRADKLLEDAGIADCLREQGLVHWTEKNWGDVDLTPRVRYIVEEPDDALKEAQTLEAVGVAITALQLAGLDIDTDAIAEQWDIPMQPTQPGADPEDAAAGESKVALTPSALAAIVKVNEARAAAGLGPLDGADGDLTVAEFQAKHADTVATAAQAEAGKDGSGAGGAGDGGAPPKPPAKDPGVDQGLAKLVSLVLSIGERAGIERMSAAPGPAVAGHKRTAKYADAVMAAAKRRGQQALKGDLASIMLAIKESTSPADLEARLKKRHAGADMGSFRRVVERARIMSALAGRFGVHEEL